MKALVIDDSRTVRLILSQSLKQLGYEVVEAADGRDALERLAQSGTPDVALVDWNMPVMSGDEFVQAVRSDPRIRELPLLMMTTETEHEQVAVALQAGVNDYLMKPFSREALRQKLESLHLIRG